MDTASASNAAILSAIDAYAHALEKNEEVSISVFNSRMRVVSNIYRYTRELDVNTKVVKDTRKQLNKSKTRGRNHVCSTRYTASWLVRADHFPYPTTAGNAAPRRPQTAPVTQWHSLAAGMRCRGAARVAGSCHCVPLG